MFAIDILKRKIFTFLSSLTRNEIELTLIYVLLGDFSNGSIVLTRFLKPTFYLEERWRGERPGPRNHGERSKPPELAFRISEFWQ